MKKIRCNTLLSTYWKRLGHSQPLGIKFHYMLVKALLEDRLGYGARRGAPLLKIIETMNMYPSAEIPTPAV